MWNNGHIPAFFLSMKGWGLGSRRYVTVVSHLNRAVTAVWQIQWVMLLSWWLSVKTITVGFSLLSVQDQIAIGSRWDGRCWSSLSCWTVNSRLQWKSTGENNAGLHQTSAHKPQGYRCLQPPPSRASHNHEPLQWPARGGGVQHIGCGTGTWPACCPRTAVVVVVAAQPRASSEIAVDCEA